MYFAASAELENEFVVPKSDSMSFQCAPSLRATVFFVSDASEIGCGNTVAEFEPLIRCLESQSEQISAVRVKMVPSSNKAAPSSLSSALDILIEAFRQNSHPECVT